MRLVDDGTFTSIAILSQNKPWQLITINDNRHNTSQQNYYNNVIKTVFAPFVFSVIKCCPRVSQRTHGTCTPVHRRWHPHQRLGEYFFIDHCHLLSETGQIVSEHPSHWEKQTPSPLATMWTCWIEENVFFLFIKEHPQH